MEKLKSVYNTLRFLIKTLIYSRLWIALCTLCYVQASFLLFQGRTDISVYSVFLALGSYLLYVLPFLYYGFKGVIRASNPRQLWVERDIHRLYITTAVVIAAIAILMYFYTEIFWRMAVHGFVVVVVTVLYELPLIPWKGRIYALRQAGILKPLILTFVWWYMGAYLVAKNKADEFTGFVTHLSPADIGILVLQLVFMLLLCVIFDIRDQDNDRQSGIRTWPVAIGRKHTQRLLGGISGAAMLASIFLPVLPAYKIAYLLVFGALLIFNLRNLQRAPWWFYDLVIDGMMVGQWVLLLLLRWWLG